MNDLVENSSVMDCYHVIIAVFFYSGRCWCLKNYISRDVSDCCSNWGKSTHSHKNRNLCWGGRTSERLFPLWRVHLGHFILVVLHIFHIVPEWAKRFFPFFGFVNRGAFLSASPNRHPTTHEGAPKISVTFSPWRVLYNIVFTSLYTV